MDLGALIGALGGSASRFSPASCRRGRHAPSSRSVAARTGRPPDHSRLPEPFGPNLVQSARRMAGFSRRQLFTCACHRATLRGIRSCRSASLARFGRYTSRLPVAIRSFPVQQRSRLLGIETEGRLESPPPAREVIVRLLHVGQEGLIPIQRKWDPDAHEIRPSTSRRPSHGGRAGIPLHCHGAGLTAQASGPERGTQLGLFLSPGGVNTSCRSLNEPPGVGPPLMTWICPLTTADPRP